MPRFARPVCATLAVSLLSLLAACSTNAADDGATDESNQTAAASTIAFEAGDFAVETKGKLVAGSKVVVTYDPARLPACRGNVGGGGPGWSITGYASFNGQPATTFEATRLTADKKDREAAPYELKLPEGGDLALWFQVSSRFGCSEFDSQYGQNFHFDVAGPAPEADATLVFRANGKVEQSAPLKAGAKVAVRYEQERLDECRSSYNGHAAWSITGHAKVNDGEELTFSTARQLDASGHKRAPVDSFIQLGAAGELALWFENTGRECVAWDSKDGDNYRFAIER